MLALRRPNTPSLFDSFLDDIFNLPVTSVDNERPVYDIIENEEQYEIHTFMPGLKKEETKIYIKKGILTIKAERKEDKDIKYKYRKSYSGKYKLYFKLHEVEDIDTENISASMVDGLLKVILPKDVEKIKEKDIKIT